MGSVGKFVVGGLLIGASFIPGVGAIAGGILRTALMTAGTGLMQQGLAQMGIKQKGLELQANTIDPQNPLPVVYGRQLLGLRIIELRVDPNSSDRKQLWLVGALCHGSEHGLGIEAIDEVYFDNHLAIAADGTVQDYWSGKLLFAKFTGLDAQDVGAGVGSYQTNLDYLNQQSLRSRFPTEWSASPPHAGVGIACLVLRLEWDQEVYASGIPNITCIVRGNKVYDPRGADPRATIASWAYSTNPVLCLADYLLSGRYGEGLSPTTEIDMGVAGNDASSSFRNMAAFCDAQVNDPSGNHPRFACHTALSPANDPRDNVRQILSACRGNLFWEGGKTLVAIRDVQAPGSLTLDESVIIGDWSFRPGGISDSPNIVRATFLDAERNYQAETVQWPAPDVVNTYLAEDNSFEVGLDLELPATSDRYKAEQLALVALKEMRTSMRVSVTCRETALQLRVGDVVNVTHATPGWENQPFWVTEILFSPMGREVTLTLDAYVATAYDLDPQTQYPTLPATNLPDPRYVAPPTNVALLCNEGTSVRLPDGSVQNRILVTWTPPSDPFVNHYLLFAGEVGGNIGTYGPALLGDTFYYIPVGHDEVWQVQMHAVNTMSRTSALTPVEYVTTPVLNAEQASDNVLVNADGQHSALGEDAAGWTFGGGFPLVVRDDYVKYGDRALKIFNSNEADSYSYQDVTVISGEVVECAGWVSTQGPLTGTGEGVVLHLSAVSSAFTLTLLDWAGLYGDVQASDVAFGVAKGQGQGWQFARALVRCNGAGTLRFYAQVGYRGPLEGGGYFDALSLRQLTPNVPVGSQLARDLITEDYNVWVPDTATVKVGEANPGGSPVPSYVTKVLRIPAGQVVPGSNNTQWSYGFAGDSVGVTSTNPTVMQYFIAAVLLPKGVTITGVAARVYRYSNAQTNETKLYRSGATPGSATLLATLTLSANDTWTTLSAAVSQVVGDEQYGLLIAMDHQSQLNPAQFAWAEVTYRMPSYDKAI